jgi:hypothetical protein
MQIHGAHTRTGKVIRDGLRITINMEIIKGTTHAHPHIFRPKIGNSIALAIRGSDDYPYNEDFSNFLILITVS